MQATLMNFGDNTRVVNDSNNVAMSIGIGELKECDIHDVHFHMIKRAIATETLLVVPKEVKKTERLTAIMNLMAELSTEAYDDVLTKYNLLDAPEEGEAPKIRPTRDQMRMTLRDMARAEVAAALRMQSKVFIREEQTRETPPQPKAPEPAPAPAKAPTKKAKAAKAPKKAAKKPVPSTRKRERL